MTSLFRPPPSHGTLYNKVCKQIVKVTNVANIYLQLKGAVCGDDDSSPDGVLRETSVDKVAEGTGRRATPCEKKKKKNADI